MVDLHWLFSPRSIAVVGASHNPDKIGTQIFKNVLNSGKHISVYPVNIKGGVIAGVKAYTSLLEVPQAVDVAIVAVPAPAVIDVLSDAILRKVKFVVVITAGFKETGTKGALLERRLKHMVKEARSNGVGVYIMGVNCLGFSSHESFALNATFLPALPPDGDVAFVSQSGAFGASVVDFLRKDALFGLKYFVSIGNKTDLSELEFFEYFGLQKIKTIAAYLESIKDPVHFVELVKTLTHVKNKNVVLLMPGESKSAKAAVRSHTGGFVKDSDTIKLALKQAGAIVVNSVKELFDTIYVLDKYPRQYVEAINNVMIVTNAGGPGVLTVDLLDKTGFKIARLNTRLQHVLRKNLPYGASVHGPVDVLGDAKADRYKIALETVAKQSDVDAIITILTPQTTTEPLKTAKYLLEVATKVKTKPFFAVFMGGERVKHAKEMLQPIIPTFSYPALLVNSLKNLKQSELQQKRVSVHNNNRRGTVYARKDTGSSILVSKALQGIGQKLCNFWIKRDGPRLDPRLTEGLLLSLGLNLPASFYLHPQKIAKHKVYSYVKQASKSVRFPWVIKKTGTNILHATDSHGVVANIKNKHEAKKVIESFINTYKKENKKGKPSFELIQIQHQVPIDVELFVGIKNSIKGMPLLIVGWGGIYTEIIKDIQKVVLPISKNMLREKISELKVWNILQGARGKSGFNLDEILDSVYKLSQLPFVIPCMHEADFNPIIVNRSGVYAVDYKIIKAG